MTTLGRYIYEDVLPFAVMVIVECTNVGTNTLFKKATLQGLSCYIFVVYSYVIASLVLLPFPFFFRRSTMLPPLDYKIIGKLFLLGLFGSACLLMGYKGIEYGSPTLASAMGNLIPTFTFILAIVFGMEKLVWRSLSSQAKILGTIISLAGALIFILYKGPSIIFICPQNSSLLYTNLLVSYDSKWVIGGFILGADYFLTPLKYILQTHILKEYPVELVVTLFYNIFTCIISGAFSIVAEPNWATWKLKPDIALTSIIYSGLIGSCFGNYAHAWVLQHKGPFYVAIFRPLSIVIASIMGIVFLGDTLHVGSVIGSIVICLGFYAVMWGKSREQVCENFASGNLESLCPRIPLLMNSNDENI